MEAKLEEATQEKESVTPQYARARRRLVAYIPDLVIVFFLGVMLLRVPVIGKATFACVLLYFVLFWAWRGQTPGKTFLGIKIVRQDGTPPGFIRALVRCIVVFCGPIVAYVLSRLDKNSHPYVIASVVLVALVIIVLSVSFDRHKRGIHDKLAGTYVIKLHRQAPQEIEEEVEEEAEEESPPAAEEKAEEKSPPP